VSDGFDAAPIGLCSADGELQDATPAALAVLRSLHVVDEIPAALPAELWARLDSVADGEAVEWHPPRAGRSLLGCTRYARGSGNYLLLMREVSDKRAALSERLHRERLESTGRLIASIAHDIRTTVASIVYSADFLEVSGSALSNDTLRASVHDICDASRRLQTTVDGLLDFARLGPTISVPVSLRDVLNRARGLLRSVYREGGHRLEVEVASDAEWVRGNPIIIEQIFVNLLLNAAESAPGIRDVSVRSSLADPRAELARAPEHYLCVRVQDDGPGVAQHLRATIFEPFFTTKVDATGLGLTNAREATANQEGQIVLEPTAHGASFAVYLPRSEGPR
jgi:signal transduction histidine kinase